MLFVGAGSVGSNLVRSAAAIGVRDMVVCDMDVIGDENIAVSWLEEIGETKAEDLSRHAFELYETTITAVEDEVGAYEVGNLIDEHDVDVVVVSTDTIESRRAIWEGVRQSYLDDESADILYIDFRIGGFSGNVYSFYVSDLASVDLYEQTFENRGVGLECGAKAYPGLTLGWCPMTLIDILGRHIRKSYISYHRAAHIDTSYDEPEFIISRSDI